MRELGAGNRASANQLRLVHLAGCCVLGNVLAHQPRASQTDKEIDCQHSLTCARATFDDDNSRRFDRSCMARGQGRLKDLLLVIDQHKFRLCREESLERICKSLGGPDLEFGVLLVGTSGLVDGILGGVLLELLLHGFVEIDFQHGCQANDVKQHVGQLVLYCL